VKKCGLVVDTLHWPRQAEIGSFQQQKVKDCGDF
jgi:hypothetical protein